MFRTYYFCEMPYPHPPAFEFTDITRTTMPNRWLDPDATYEAYHKYFDIVQAVDELGMDVMFNEHHGTMSNLNGPMPLSIAIAARQTKNCRLLALGNPVANRPDPVRIATEMAMIDVVSHGRLDCGFIKGIQDEMSTVNARPTDMLPRVYEAIDLIVKAWTRHDGPFNWEGEFFHHRQVNVVPRPYQQPHPPVWGTALSSLGSVTPLAERGYVMATIFAGTEKTVELFNHYRDVYKKCCSEPPHPDRLAYSAFLFVGDTDQEALNEALKIQDFINQAIRIPKGQRDLPGYIDVKGRAAILKAEMDEPGSAFRSVLVNAPPQELVDMGIAFYGNPDSVFEQMKKFFNAVGGFGALCGLSHGSTMSYALTTKGLRLYREHVLPRFREEVYEPWLKEHGLKKVMLPRSGTQLPNLGVAAGIGAPRVA